MQTEETPRLRIWRHCWGLPSIDPDCLTVLAYSRFMNVPLVIEETVPSSSITGCLPELLVEESVFASPMNIIGIFRKERYNADFHLTSVNQADTLAFAALVEQKLKPGLQSCFWLNSGNYVNVTRKALVKSYSVFRRYVDLPRICNKVKSELQLRSPSTTSDIESYWIQEAKMCITLLSKRLGDSDFFFGSRPTTFDAIAFGHLAVLLKAPLASTELKNHLLACDNLCKLCDRISQQYFKEGGYCNEKDAPKSDEADTPADDNVSHNFRIALAVAVAANVLYLLKRGFMQKIKSGVFGISDVNQ